MGSQFIRNSFLQIFRLRDSVVWPLGTHACANEVDSETDDDEDGSVAYLSQKVLAWNEHVDEPSQRDQRGQRIKPHPKRARQVGPAHAQDHHANDLSEKLHQNANHDERRDYIGQPEKTEQRCNTAHDKQRDIRQAMTWVHARKDPEVVSVTRSRKRYARITQQQREDGRERRPHDQRRRDETRFGSVESFHERGDDVTLRRRVGGTGKFAPRNDAKDRNVHHDVDHRNEQDRKEHRARDRSSWVFHFATKEADVVIAPVIVNRDEQRSAQPGEEFGAQGKCARWKIECEFWIKMCNTREDYPQNRQHHADPQKL